MTSALTDEERETLHLGWPMRLFGTTLAAVLLTACSAAPTPEAPATTATATTTFVSTLRCSTFLADGKQTILIPDTLLREGCIRDDGTRATVESYACRNGSTLHIVGGRWMVAPSTVHDATLSDPAFFGPEILRKACVEGLR